jgi:hypothetical protein
MQHPSTTTPSGWLAFELSILYRLNFGSVAMPFTGDPTIGTYLKRRDVRVTSNDVLRSDWYRSLSVIQNGTERLSDEDVNVVLDDVYVPGYKLNNPALRNWFNETDAWWFDNIRKNLDRLNSPLKSAIATSLALAVGDYVHSFDETTRELRQPLSNVFRRLWTILPEPVNNGQSNACHNKTPDEFIAESTAELLFLRLPRAEIRSSEKNKNAWREEWIRGGDDFWPDFDASMTGKIGQPVETKSQYLRLLEDALSRASHLKHWAVSHIETGFVSAQEITDAVGKHRRVEAVYTKDFSELTGKKAVIITA